MTSDFASTGTQLYSQIIHKSRYARWLYDKNRRETWNETVQRYIDFFKARFPDLAEEIQDLYEPIYNLEVVPSMRALMTAGPALERDLVSGFNCSYVVIDNPRAFDELAYILLCGTGAGFSVERQYVNKLPEVSEELHDTDSIIVVADSKIGWASAFRELVSLLYAGKVPSWDLKKIRPAGAPLKTFGGRASGPEPLDDLFSFTVALFKKAKGRKLTSLECHDLCCKVAEIVVVGGVRRAALISLSNPSDDRMRTAKSGQWWQDTPHRALANNSIAYTEKPEFDLFLKEWVALYESKSGERGMFNRTSAKKQAAKTGRRDPNYEFGCNPCSEIILRPNSFCNLSEVVVRSTDSEEDLKRKIGYATILGTLQASLTDFRYLRSVWKRNAEDEALLGVSMTGIMDHPTLNSVNDNAKRIFRDLKQHSIDVNKAWAARVGINPSTSITCTKPSGCRTGDAFTPTAEGIFTLDELLTKHGTPKEKQFTDIAGAHVVQHKKSTKASKLFNNGDAPVLEIRLSYNLTFKCTPNHKFFVSKVPKSKTAHTYKDYNDYKQAIDLNERDIVEVSWSNYNKETDVDLVRPEISYHFNTNENVLFPKTLTPDLGWLIGYLYGDGTMSEHKHRIRFIDQNIDHLEKAKFLLKSLFNLDCTIRKCTDGRDAYTLEKGTNIIYDFLKMNNIGKNLLEIPLPIRCSSKETIIAFIAGLSDSDGCISIRDNYKKLTIATHNDEFARQIQHVSWMVGLPMGRSLNTKGLNKQKVKHMWLLTTAGYGDSLSYATYNKHSMKAAKNSHVPWSWDKLNQNRRHLVGSVRKVTPVGILPTYDLEVPNEHWYYDSIVKSHNTVSQLTNAASGLHPRFAKYYIRRIRIDNKDPLCTFMQTAGFPCEPDVMNKANVVFSFPIKSPDNCVTVDDIGAMKQLEHWKMVQDEYCEHKPSITVYHTNEEFLEVGNWVWKHFDDISGISFLPKTDHVYKQAPYEAITEEQYYELDAKMPKSINWDDLALYEQEDHTEGSQSYACSSGVCELVDIGTKS